VNSDLKIPKSKQNGAGTTEIKTREGLLISTDTAKTDAEWMDWKDTRKKQYKKKVTNLSNESSN